MRKKLYLFLLVALCGAMINPAVAKKKNKKKASTEATTKKKEKKETKYDKLFKDKKVTTAKGFITLHQFDNKVYFELPLKVLNRDILLGSTIAETTDNQFGCVGEKSGDPFLIRFVQRDSTITLRRVQAGQFYAILYVDGCQLGIGRYVKGHGDRETSGIGAARFHV